MFNNTFVCSICFYIFSSDEYFWKSMTDQHWQTKRTSTLCTYYERPTKILMEIQCELKQETLSKGAYITTHFLVHNWRYIEIQNKSFICLTQVTMSESQPLHEGDEGPSCFMRNIKWISRSIGIITLIGKCV